jgi:hypothetical protein
MKKIVLLFIILSFSIMGLAGERFSVSVQGNAYIPKDSDFKDFYGSGHFFPEVKLGITVFKGFYLWGGYGFYKATGKTASQFQEEAKWTQSYLFYGGGYNAGITSSLSANVRLGGVTTTYKEQALDTEIKKTTTGFYAGGSLVFSFVRYVFAELEVGYISVLDDVGDQSLNLGGIKAGIGVGIRF